MILDFEVIAQPPNTDIAIFSLFFSIAFVIALAAKNIYM